MQLGTFNSTLPIYHLKSQQIIKNKQKTKNKKKESFTQRVKNTSSEKQRFM